MAGRQRALMLVLRRVELGCTQVRGVGDYWQPQPTPHLPEHPNTTRGLENLSPESCQLAGRPWLGASQAPGCKEGGGGSPCPRSSPSLALLRTESPYQKVP